MLIKDAIKDSKIGPKVKDDRVKSKMTDKKAKPRKSNLQRRNTKRGAAIFREEATPSTIMKFPNSNSRLRADSGEYMTSNMYEVTPIQKIESALRENSKSPKYEPDEVIELPFQHEESKELN